MAQLDLGRSSGSLHYSKNKSNKNENEGSGPGVPTEMELTRSRYSLDVGKMAGRKAEDQGVRSTNSTARVPGSGSNSILVSWVTSGMFLNFSASVSPPGE